MVFRPLISKIKHYINGENKGFANPFSDPFVAFVCGVMVALILVALARG
jgi:hypothetical protein